MGRGIHSEGVNGGIPPEKKKKNKNKNVRTERMTRVADGGRATKGSCVVRRACVGGAEDGRARCSPGNCCPAARATLRRLTRARSRRSIYTGVRHSAGPVPISAWTLSTAAAAVIFTPKRTGDAAGKRHRRRLLTPDDDDDTHTAPGTQSAISLVHTFVATSRYTFHTVHVVVTVVVFRARITRRPSIIYFYFFFSPQTPCVA